MADEKIRIDIETSAETGPVEDYQDAYEALKSQVEEAREKLVELAATPDVGADTRKAAAEEVAKLEAALKKADAQLQKSTAEAKKNERATESATDAVDDHADALSRASKAAGDGAAVTQELTEKLSNLEAAEKKASEAEAKSADSAELVKIRRANQAQVLTSVAEKLGAISSRLSAAGQEVGEFDSELGTLISTVGEVGETASSVVTNAAAGFAVGGPWGAAIGALSGLITGTLSKAYGEMLEQLENQKVAQDRAKTSMDGLVQSYRELGAEAAGSQISRIQDRLNGELQTLRRQAAEIERIIGLEKRRSELDAQVADIQQKGRFEQLDREVRSGVRSPTEAAGIKAVEVTQAEVAEIRSKSVELTAEIEKLKRARSNTESEKKLILDAISTFQDLQAAAQEDVNNGTGNIKQLVEEYTNSSNQFVRDLATDAIENHAEAEALIELSLAKQKELEKKAFESNETSRDLTQQINGLGDLFEVESQGAEAKVAAVVANVTATQLDRFSQAAQGSVEEAFKDVDGVVAKLKSTGAEISATNQAGIAQLESIKKDNIADAEQILEIRSAVEKITRGNLANFQGINETFRGVERGLATIRSEQSRIIARIEQLAARSR